MKKIIILFSVIIIIVLIIKYAFSEDASVCFNETCFKVEVVSSERERTLGLMFKESLPKDEGMLFIFEEEGNYSFWMKNMKFPLDIIWINEKKEIVFIEKEVQPCKSDYCEGILPEKKAKYVLEINAGITDDLFIKEGDKVIINFKQ